VYDPFYADDSDHSEGSDAELEALLTEKEREEAKQSEKESGRKQWAALSSSSKSKSYVLCFHGNKFLKARKLEAEKNQGGDGKGNQKQK
jgi:hypothetical protein